MLLAPTDMSSPRARRGPAIEPIESGFQEIGLPMPSSWGAITGGSDRTLLVIRPQNRVALLTYLTFVNFSLLSASKATSQDHRRPPYFLL